MLPRGSAMHQSCASAGPQKENRCFQKVQGRIPRHIKAVHKKYVFRRMVNTSPSQCGLGIILQLSG